MSSRSASAYSINAYSELYFTQCQVDEALVLETAGLMKSLGLIVITPTYVIPIFWYLLKDVGYTHLNLDDCWALKNRSAQGLLVPGRWTDLSKDFFYSFLLDPAKFPSGFNSLTSKLHKLGLWVLSIDSYPMSYNISRPNRNAGIVCKYLCIWRLLIPSKYSDSGWFTCMFFIIIKIVSDPSWRDFKVLDSLVHSSTKKGK